LSVVMLKAAARPNFCCVDAGGAELQALASFWRPGGIPLFTMLVSFSRLSSK
jgi:hypothetical protein